MKKGERIEISVSVVATADVDEEHADRVAFTALARARDYMLSTGYFRRVTSAVDVSGPRRSMRRGRDFVPGEVCTCHLGIETLCARHPYRRRRGRTETPPEGSGKAN